MASSDIDDLEERQKTFGLFLRLLRWSVALTAIVLIAMLVFLVGNPYA